MAKKWKIDLGTTALILGILAILFTVIMIIVAVIK
jgi:hypothetical protein